MVVEAIPSCLVPSNVSLVATGADTVKLSWDFANSGTQFSYINVAAGTTPSGQGTVISADSVTITSLSANTSYDFYVREICGAGDSSTWVGPFSYTTNCNLISAFPWVEDFESVSTPAVPVCFSVNNANNDGDEWETQSSSTYANSGSQSVEIYTDFNSGNNDDYLILPGFDLTGNERLRYWFRARSSVEPNDFQVLVSQTGTAPADFTDTIEVDTATSTTYSETIIDLSAYSGATYIAFHIPNGGLDGYYFYMDDMVVEAIPSCLAPSNTEALATWTDSARITWDFANSGTQFSYINVAAGTTPSGQGTVVNNDSVTVTGLTVNTAYDFYVREICAVGDTSAWFGPFTYYTIPTANGISCGSAYSEIIFSEEFDDNSAGWTGDIGSGNYDWEIPNDATSSNTGADDAYSGSNYMNFEASGTSLDTGSIVSPMIDLSTATTSAELSFWMHAYGADMGELYVGVGTSATGPFTNVFTWIGDLQQSGSDAWQNVGVDLSAYLGQQIYVQFMQVDSTDFAGDMSIDLFEVTSCVSCPAPTGVVASNITNTGAKLNWSFVGAGANFAYINVPTGTAPSGQGTVITADSIELTSLTPNSTYDFYVREVCGAADSSVWVGPVSYTTLCSVFSAPFVENFDGAEWVSGTGFNNVNDTISACWSRNNVPTAYAWGTRTGTTSSSLTGPSQDNTTGSSNYVYVEANNGSANDVAILETPSIDLTGLVNPYLRFAYHMYGDDISKLYISVNDGSTITVVDSIVGEQQTDNADAWINHFVDLTAYAGQTISVEWETEKDGTNGDVAIDDVEIYNQLADDAAVIGFVPLVSNCGNALTEIKAIVQNFGTNSISGFDVVVDWTGSTTGSISRTYTGNLGFNEIDTIIVDTLNTTLGGTFNLEGYTQLPSDGNINNDTTLANGVTILAALSAPTLVSPSSIVVCAGDTAVVEAQAVAGANVIWRDEDGNFLANGDSLRFTAGSVSDTLYASQAYGAAGIQIGPLDNTIGAGGNFTAVTGQSLEFNVTSPITIDSVTIYPDGSGDLEIEIEENGTVVFSTIVNVVAPSAGVAVTVPVGATLVPGSYQLGAGGATTIGMYRNSAGAVYPYSSPSGSVSITGNTFDPVYYYFYYNWVISESNCESSAVMLTYTTDSVVVDLGTDITYCAGTAFSATLDAGNTGATYLWNDGSVGQTLVVDTAGTYYVEVTNANGCSDIDTLVVSEDVVLVDLGSDLSYCIGTVFSATLDAGNAGATYLWSDGSASQTLAVDTAGTYWVIVTNGNGCTSTDSVIVTEEALPVVSVSNEEICDGETGTLDAGAGFAAYAWNTSETSQTIDVTMAGTYTVTVSNAAGCSSVDSATVTVNTVTVGVPDVTICDGATVEIDAGAGYASYAWSTGETTQSIDVTTSDDYSVTVTSSEGCTASDTATVVFNPLPVVDLGPDTSLSSGQSIVLDAGNAGSTYDWSTGATSQTITVNSDDVPTTIRVEVTSPEGCGAADEIEITKATGIAQLISGSISTYPNPVESEFHIAFTAKESRSIAIEVYDVSGQLVEVSNNEINAGREDLVVDMSAYGSGVYIVKATLNNQVIGQFRAVKR
jgi:hypothetical protein